jgi:selenide,water dikinase
MATLNQDAARIMLKYPVHACTDITGFGLIGHMAEMVCDSGCGVIVFSKDLPIIPEALEYAKMGLIPAGAYKNREFRELMIEIGNSVPQQIIDVMFDPQTSGGLLISVSKEASKELVFELRKNKISAVVIAEVADKPAGRIKII